MIICLNGPFIGGKSTTPLGHLQRLLGSHGEVFLDEKGTSR
ncbi:hypothetical protein ACIBK8_32900 [Streptomyces sp. NPDC050161]